MTSVNHTYTTVHVDETYIGTGSSDNLTCDNNSDEISSNNSATSGSMEIVLRPAETSIVESSSKSNRSIGSVTVKNSTDVTFGNKSFFNGPVVIKKFVVNNSDIQKQVFDIAEDAPGNA